MTRNDPSLEALQAEVRQLRSVVERRRRFGPLVMALVLVSTFASAQLVTFNPDEPAIAAQVNANFNQLKTWLEQKVGTVGTNTVTTGGIVLGAPGAQATLGSAGPGQLTVSGGLTLLDASTGINSARLGVAASIPNGSNFNAATPFLEGTFSDPGGTIVIMASATAYCSSVGRITMRVLVDGQIAGAMRLFCNTVSAHMAFPPTFIRLSRSALTAPGPGVTRTVRLEPVSCSVSNPCNPGLVTAIVDVNDYGEVTVVRLPTP